MLQYIQQKQQESLIQRSNLTYISICTTVQKHKRCIIESCTVSTSVLLTPYKECDNGQKLNYNYRPHIIKMGLHSITEDST